MWKWILGGLLVVVLIVAGAAWYGYKKLTAGGDSASVAIAASPERVFASLSDPDSMEQWMEAGTVVTATHHGTMEVGDTVHVEEHTGRGSHTQEYTWTVSAVVPNRLLALEMRDDSNRKVFATRRDSLVQAGDSTVIISTIASPMMDSIRTMRDDSGGRVGGAAIGFTSRILVSAFRELSKHELERLKLRLETHGAAATPPSAPTPP
jgi:uncharacterized protein YndB with AHSA1/START domain